MKQTRKQVEMLHSMRLQDANAKIADLTAQLAAAKRDGQRLDWIESEAKGNMFDWIKIYPIARIVGANPNAKDAHATLRAAIDAEIDAARQKEGK